MRTIPMTAWVLCLLTPVLALAQSGMGPTESQQVTHSPLSWFWVVAVAIAIAAFVASYIVVNRRRVPPSGPTGF